MSLVTVYRTRPVFAVTQGALLNGPSTTLLFLYSNTVLQFNKVVQNSTSRLTFGEAGSYEVLIPFEINVSGSPVVTLQYGVNGTWTSFGTLNPQGNATIYGNFNLIIDIPKNGYLEFRATSGSNINWTYIGTGQGTVAGVKPSIFIRKL